MAVIDRSDPAIPDRNQGADTMARIGIASILNAVFAAIQLKARYNADPKTNPNRAKESKIFVLPNDIIGSPSLFKAY